MTLYSDWLVCRKSNRRAIVKHRWTDKRHACSGRRTNLELRVLNTELRVLNRPKGRPSKKDGQRVSAYTPKAANKYRATVTTIGDLLYVEKSKCKKCGQYGHTLGTCQGKGYIGAIVDSMQAAIYNARLKEEASALKRKCE